MQMETLAYLKAVRKYLRKMVIFFSVDMLPQIASVTVFKMKLLKSKN